MNQDQQSSAPELLTDIERFLDATGMSATAFGARTANDTHLVHDLRAGREVSAPMVERIKSFMAAERRRIVSLLAPDTAQQAPSEAAAE